VFCRSLFVLLFFWLLYFLSFDIWPVITPMESSIYGLWLPPWNLRYMVCDYPHGIFKLVLLLWKDFKIYICQLKRCLQENEIKFSQWIPLHWKIPKYVYSLSKARTSISCYSLAMTGRGRKEPPHW
jgi:hypothetical protein